MANSKPIVIVDSIDLIQVMLVHEINVVLLLHSEVGIYLLEMLALLSSIKANDVFHLPILIGGPDVFKVELSLEELSHPLEAVVVMEDELILRDLFPKIRFPLMIIGPDIEQILGSSLVQEVNKLLHILVVCDEGLVVLAFKLLFVFGLESGLFGVKEEVSLSLFFFGLNLLNLDIVKRSDFSSLFGGLFSDISIV